MLITQLAFHEPTPRDALWAAPLLTASARQGCEYSYTTIYMWRAMYDVRIARGRDMLFVSSKIGEDVYFLPPVGPSFKEGMAMLEAYAAEQGMPLRLYGVDESVMEQLVSLYGDRLAATEHPEDDDYLYRTADLAELPGNAYHSKKNHISAFSRRFSWVYEPIDDSNVAEVLTTAKRWCAEKGTCRDRGISTERCAIRELLQERERFGVLGGLIRVDGTVAAFTLGSPINDTVFDVHVEKALAAYPGAYAVINREFALRLGQYEYLNRENDLGIEGLRRAKRSYHPAILLKKYVCEIH